MMNEYVKDSNFWEAPMDLLHSGTWKFITESRQIAKKHMKVCIGNGEHTSLWYDSWLKGGALIDHVGKLYPDIIRHLNWKVSVLIQNNNWIQPIHSLASFWDWVLKTDIHA